MRAGASRRAARVGRDVRRARGARRPPAGGARCRDVLRALRARALPARASRGERRRRRQLGDARRRLQAQAARARRSLALSLSDELREELAQIAPLRRCCRLAELSALFHVSGAWHLRDGAVAVHLDLAASAGARRAFALLRDLGVRSEIRTYRRSSFDRATRFELHVDVDEAALAVLRESGVLSATGAPLETPPKRVVGRSCCRGAYLRGALLGAGSLSGPRDPHLEIRTGTVAAARFAQRTAQAEDVALSIGERRGHALAYAKGHEAIAATLALAGAG